MKSFDIQAVEINSTFEKAFHYIANVCNLPAWTCAFKKVSDGKALLETPDGSVEIGLKVNASRDQGTIDWMMRFPDGSVATAYSRVVDAGNSRCLYSFILLATGPAGTAGGYAAATVGDAQGGTCSFDFDFE